MGANSIYASCVGAYEDHLLVADNYFDKTRANLKAGCKGAILFMTDEGKPVQAKGALSYHEAGPLHAEMKRWNPEKHPGHAAAALHVEEAYSGSERLS